MVAENEILIWVRLERESERVEKSREMRRTSPARERV